jgi:cardiolipin synthase
MRFRHPRLHWHPGNHLTLLENGEGLFPAMCKAFDSAKTSIHLETYIFRLDDTGTHILRHLAQAVERGVKVRVVIDGYGCVDHDLEIQARLEAVGVQCRIYRPEPRRFGLFVFNMLRFKRLHRKLCVVDSHVAFIGGINIEDDFVDQAGVHTGEHATSTLTLKNDPRFDYAVRATGPVVSDMVQALDLLWLRLTWIRPVFGSGDRPDSKMITDSDLDLQTGRQTTKHAWRHLHFRRNLHRSSSYKQTGDTTAALALRDNLLFRRTIEASYLKAIQNARHDIVIANAYFLPGHTLRQALSDAAKRGVRVRLLLQGKIEYHLQYHATRWIYDYFLRQGVEIFEYMPSFLHAKVAVIDSIAIVGSSNLDPFSLLLAREANLVIDDAGFAAELRQSLQAAMMLGSKIIEQRLYDSRGWLTRLLDSMAYRLLRFGVALSGKGNDSEY